MKVTLREVWARFASLPRKRYLDQDFDEEARAHIELAVEENLKRGMSAAEARRQALIQFGGLEPAKELHRDTRGWPGFEDFVKDFRFSLRQLLKSPGFTITAILSLALGIGATTAMFSLVYAVLINPYPYAGADRIVNPVAKDLTLPPGIQIPFTHDWFDLTGPQFEIFRKAKAIDDVVGFAWTRQIITGGELPESIGLTYMTSNVDGFNRVPPLLGRDIMPFDAPKGRPAQPVVVLSYRFWQRRYNGDPKVIGRTIQLEHKNYTIIGVRTPRNTFGGNDTSAPIQLTGNPNNTVIPYIKLKRSVSLATANAEFQALLEQFAKETPKHFPKKFRVQVQPLIEPVVERTGHTLSLLFAAVALLLLIGCANCSILLLARGTTRQHELAVRSALGASRTRIVRQLMSESLTLSVAGTAIGVVSAYHLAKLSLLWLHDAFPSEAAIEINLPILCFSVGMALLTGVVFGLFPALRISRPDLIQTIHASVRRATGGTSTKRFHYALVAGQVALTLLLLSGATAASAGFLSLLRTDLGFDPHNTLHVDIALHENSYVNWKERSVYFDQLRQRISSVPGVLGVALAGNAIPPSNAKYFRGMNFEILGKPKAQNQLVGFSVVSPNYFSLLHIPLLKGRVWDAAETEGGARLAVINVAMARHYWPDEDPVGKQIRFPELKGQSPFLLTVPGSDGPMQIIGVVGDARNDGLIKPAKPAVYLPYTVLMWGAAQMLVRTGGNPMSSLQTVRKAVQSVNPEQEIMQGADSLEDRIKEEPEWAQEHIVSVLFSGFAFLALTLAAVGLYSVVSYGVTQRTNEFGIRMALGAQRWEVLRLVFSSISIAVASGLIAGIVLVVVFNQLIGHWVQGSVRDPWIVLSIVLTLAVVAGLAVLIPARRASSIDPIHALQHE